MNNMSNTRNNIIKLICVAMVVIGMLSGCRTSTAGYNYEAARLQYNQKNYEKALEYINKSIATSQKAEYLIFQGDILQELQKKDDAIAAYSKAIKESTDTISLENNKQAYTKLTIAYIKNENYDLANKNVEKALEIDVLNNMNKEILLYKMDILLYIKKYKEVVSCGDEYVKKYTDSKDAARAYIKMGRAYSEVRNYEKALSYYDKAIKDDNDTLYYRAMTYKEMGEYEKSFNDYESFLKVSKADIKQAVYTKQLECLYEWAKRSADAEALAKAEKVVTAGMASQDEENIKLFGKAYIALLERKGEYEEAYVYAQEYAAEYPGDEAIQKEIKFLETRILPAE